MKYSWMQAASAPLALCCAVLAAVLFSGVATSQTKKTTPQAVVLSARMERGRLIYRLNGKRVEDTINNSLLTNLTEIVKTRGTKVPVIIIIDVQAPFTEVGKLETAFDKADLTYSRRLFVTDFRGGIMNEIHWDQTPVPIPAGN